MKSLLKLGTRKSLLAWAQSGWVAREIESKNPGVQVKLVGIETRGDRILDIPLSQIEGKEFFVAEIDQALKSGAVDLTVHSLKDLSLDRPQELTLGAMPKRENPRDIILFSPRILEQLKAGKTLKIGTSSPRRLENIPPFLVKALPQLHPDSVRMEFLEIRGNVNTRLKRVHDSPDSERYLDAVVLAFAGLIRLWADSSGRSELKTILEGVRWMILPLKECPAAPGQGALAVECRAEDTLVKEMLQKIHDEHTARAVASERQILAKSGGGCHQRFGATSITHRELGQVIYVKGKDFGGATLDQFLWQKPDLHSLSTPTLQKKEKVSFAWDGSKHRAEVINHELDKKYLSRINSLSHPALFVAHSRALQHAPADFAEQTKSLRVWTSGIESWFKLARLGVWVEGCAEGFGFDQGVSVLNEPVLRLPELKNWTVFTHEGATGELGGWDKYECNVVPTYEIGTGKYPTQTKTELQEASYVFWSSGSQFIELKEYLNLTSENVIHACGPGKTAASLRADGIKPLIFPTAEEWRKWINQQDIKIL